MRPLLGTYVEIAVESSPEADQALTAAFDRIADVHNRLSYHDKSSELSLLNASHGSWVSISPLTREILGIAVSVSEKTGNLFNPFVGSLLERRGLLPRVGEQGGLEAGSYEDLDFNGDQARLRAGIKVVLDGIAKGWAVDLAVEELIKAGARMGYVNAGGDMRIFGRISIPVRIRSLSNGFSTELTLCNYALATSSYAKNLIDAAPSALVGRGECTVPSGTWTVKAPKAYLADALTKVAALTSGQQRIDLLSLFDAQCVFEEKEVQ